MRWALGILALFTACATVPTLERPQIAPDREIFTYSKRARVAMHAVRMGEDRGKLPIVLIHPWAADHRIWDLVVPALSKDRLVLAVDLPGHGGSGHPPGRFPPRRLAEAVSDTMASQGIARAIVIGNSLGGATAIELGLSDPSRVAGLVLLGAPGGAPVPETLKALVLRATAPRALATVSVPSLRLAIRFAARSTQPGVGMLIDDMIEARTSVWLSASEALSSTLKEVMSYRPPLEELRAPVLVLAGEDDAVVPLAAQQAIAERAPGGRLVPLADCGHFPEVDCPPAFLASLLPFLAQLEEGR